MLDKNGQKRHKGKNHNSKIFAQKAFFRVRARVGVPYLGVRVRGIARARVRDIY